MKALKQMDTLSTFLGFWPLICAVVAFVAGYSDLKANHKSLRRDFDASEERRCKERESDKADRQRDNEMTREMFREIRGDIKEILQRGRD